MTDAEKAVVQEAMKLIDDGLALLLTANSNAKVALLAHLVHGAISVGEMML